MNQQKTPADRPSDPKRSATVPPLRSLHHFACTGGTLLSKCVAVAENVLLLSEIDPLSPLALPGKDAAPMFRPTDMIYGIRTGPRPLAPLALERIFLGGLRQLRAITAKEGLALVIRDHTHSHYCTSANPAARPTMQRMLKRTGPVLSLVSVRHPLDSFLSLDTNGWQHFRPFTLEEYARRYLVFLDDYANVPLIRYEDLLSDTSHVLRRVCDILELHYSRDLAARRNEVRLSGDSGRQSSPLELRPRRPIPGKIAAMLDGVESGNGYHVLCARLGYDPAPDAEPLLKAEGNKMP